MEGPGGGGSLNLFLPGSNAPHDLHQSSSRLLQTRETYLLPQERDQKTRLVPG